MDGLNGLIKKKGTEYIKSHFRICHHSHACMKYANHPNVRDNHLPDFLGELGFIKLLSFMDMGKTMIPDVDYTGPRIDNFREYTDLLRRLFLPYYEEARYYWQNAENDGEFTETNEVTMYQEWKLKEIIEKYTDEN